jgi:hypothetical protein
MGVGDMAQAEAEYSGWLSKLLTDPVKGLENYSELFQKLTSPNGAIKVFCEVASGCASTAINLGVRIISVFCSGELASTPIRLVVSNQPCLFMGTP